jgi:tetratricopeptide (TPR) repeat protein
VTLTAPEIEALVTRIEAHPRLNVSNRLGVYSGLLRVEPQRRQAILESLMMDYRNASPEDLRVFLQWLAFEGEPSLLRSLVTTSSLYQDASVFTPYAQSLSTGKRWRDLVTLLEDTTHPLPVSAERTAIWLAEAWSNLEPDMQKAAVHLERSIDFAIKSGNQETLLIAAKEAQKYGLWEIAIRGHTALADSNPKVSIPLLEMGLEAATQKGDTEEIYRLTRRLCDLQPKNNDYSARLCYLRLLIGDEIETVEVPDVSRVKPAVRSLLLSLTAYLIRDHTLLKTHLAAIENIDDFSAGQKAVYAGMLATCGDLAQAFQIAERIPMSVLLKEEQKLLKAAL